MGLKHREDFPTICSVYKYADADRIEDSFSSFAIEHVEKMVRAGYGDRLGVAATGYMSGGSFSDDMVRHARVFGLTPRLSYIIVVYPDDVEELRAHGCQIVYDGGESRGAWSDYIKHDYRGWTFKASKAVGAADELVKYISIAKTVQNEFIRYSGLNPNAIPGLVRKMTLGHAEIPVPDKDVARRAKIASNSAEIVNKVFATASDDIFEKDDMLRYIVDARRVWDAAAKDLLIENATFDFTREDADIRHAAEVLGVEPAIEAVFAGVPVEDVLV